MPTPDELADALITRYQADGFSFSRLGDDLRTLAREAAKQALIDAALDVVNGGQVSMQELPIRPVRTEIGKWLRGRADQIGKDSE